MNDHEKTLQGVKEGTLGTTKKQRTKYFMERFSFKSHFSASLLGFLPGTRDLGKSTHWFLRTRRPFINYVYSQSGSRNDESLSTILNKTVNQSGWESQKRLKICFVNDH